MPGGVQKTILSNIGGQTVKVFVVVSDPYKFKDSSSKQYLQDKGVKRQNAKQINVFASFVIQM